MDSNDHKPVYSKSRFPKQIAPGTCRGCHQPIMAKRRKTWCSDVCKKKYDPYWVKRAVVERDKHICQMCGMDIRATYAAWLKAKPTTGYYMQPAWREWFKGKVKEAWGKLTDDDLDVINGRREQMVGKMQERYGVAKDEAEKQVKDWEARNNYRW